MTPKNLRLILYIIVFTKNVLGGKNVLIATYFPIHSHYIWNNAIAEALVVRGYNVTFMSSSSQPEKSTENYHQILIEDMNKAFKSTLHPDLLIGMTALDTIWSMNTNGAKLCEIAYKTKGFQRIKAYPKNFKFDLILFEMTASPCLLPFIQKFNYAPAIGLSTLLLPPFLSNRFGNSMYPSYIPHYSIRHNMEANFLHRLENYICYYFDLIMREVYLRMKIERAIRKEFGEGTESVRTLERHISLLFANIDPILNDAQPLTANIIPVGGLHLGKPKELYQDIQEIMDNAREGVILFSFGTNVQSVGINERTIKAILDAFREIKQTVLWKFDGNLTELPNNVVVRKWLPQIEILAHPNLKLFISHGGALSTYESSYFGVPIIGIPFMIDQHVNVDNLVSKKVAVKIEFTKLTTEILFDSINEVLYNPSYASNMMVLSRRLKDKTVTSLESAIYWIEYAIRHNGTHFLDPKSRDQTIFISSSMDMHIFLLILLGLTVFLLSGIIKMFKNLTRKKKMENKKHV